MRLDSSFFEKILDFSFSEKGKKEIDNYEIEVEDLSPSQVKDKKKIIKEFLIKDSFVYSGNHRLADWNSGWDENGLEFENTKNPGALIPKYFGKFDTIRLDGSFRKILKKETELHTLRVLQRYLYEKYCNGYKNFYEFGCGTGHNLLELSRMANNEVEIYGFDWTMTPSRIFANINKFFDKNFIFNRFDFTKPDYSVTIKKDSVVFTFAALEQIGDKNLEFIKFLCDKKPSLCLHLEPITELLDESDELQKLSIDYIKKRNYLSGFYDNLKMLEAQNKIEIIDAKRTKIGSFFLEGYSLVAWRPI